MSAAEKRYFRRRAAQHGRIHPHYLQLFDILQTLEKWDIKILQQQIADTDWADKLPLVTRYLWEQLLDSLTAFAQDKNPYGRIARTLDHAVVLLDRNMITAAVKALQKAQKEMQKYTLYTLWPRWATLQQRVLTQSLKQTARPAELDNWLTDYRYGLQQLDTEAAQAHLYLRSSHNHLRGQADTSDLQPLFEHIAAPAVQTNWRAEADYWQGKATFHFIERQADKALAANQSLSLILEAALPRHPEVAGRYLAILYNLLVDQLQLGQYDALFAGLDKLRALPTQPAFNQLAAIDEKVFHWTASLELNAYVRRKEYTLAATRLAAIGQKFEQYEHALPPQTVISLRYLLALLAFYAEQYADTLTWLTPLYQQPNPDLLKIVLPYVRWLFCLTHYELGNDDLLDSMLTAEKRKQRQQPDRQGLLVQSYAYLQQLSTTYSRNEQRQRYQEWLLFLQTYPDDSDKKTFSAYFDWSFYLHKKLQ